jgi:hypothetical protein
LQGLPFFAFGALLIIYGAPEFIVPDALRVRAKFIAAMVAVCKHHPEIIKRDEHVPTRIPSVVTPFTPWASTNRVGRLIG